MPTYTNYRDQSLVVTHLITKDEALKLQPVWTDIEHADCWQEKRLSGCSELLDKFIGTDDRGLKEQLSLMIWSLIDLAARFTCTLYRMEDIFEGRYFYFNGNRRFCDYFVTSEVIRLRTLPWLMNSKGEFVSSDKLTKQTLSKKYTNRDNFDDMDLNKMLKFLRIRDEKEPTFDELSPEMQEQILLGRQVKKCMQMCNITDPQRIINMITTLISVRSLGDSEDKDGIRQ